MVDINWAEFHFLRPAYLWLLIPAVLLLWKGMNRGGGQGGWEQSCDPELLEAMQVQTAQKGSKLQLLYWPVALIAILAISGPAVRKVAVPVVQNQSALVLALDVSRSMLADDIKPSRLQRAKFKIEDLLADRKDGQTALVVYAGDAFVVTPLTDDVETIIAMLEAVEPSIMPVKGTNTVTALEKAANLLAQSGIQKGEILLITDSIALNKVKNTLTDLANQKIKTHVMAVGTKAGAPIPTPRGFVKDLRGQIVVPKLDFNSLQQAAEAGNGYFTVLSSGDDFIGMFDADASTEADEDNPFEDDDMGSENYIDDGPFLALLLLPLVVLMYRRGMLLFLALGVVLPLEQSHALSWDDLWLNKDQQAWQHLQNKQAEQAQNTAIDPKIQAAAAYENKQFKQAADLYQDQASELDKYYNQGNALAQAQEFEKALESYDQALTFNPEDEDTLYNKKIVEEALKQQEQQQNEQGEQGDESDEEKSGDQEQDTEQQDSDQQDSEQQDSEQQKSEEEKQQENSEQKQQAEKDENAEETEQQEQQKNQEQQDQQEQKEAELTPEEKALDAEEKQAMEQWLRRIKDDPGGLLRRKFLYQYHRNNQNGDDYQTTEDW